MTKICRDNQIEKLNSILNAVENIRDWKRFASEEKVLDLLTKMQQIVISIGNIIEQDMHDYHDLIAELEQLCELLYQMSVSLNEHRQLGMLVNDAKKRIISFREALQAVTPRKEIVFLPYQVAMWDSLESVWQAAKEDGKADCYVVPIPYYDVMPDNSLGALHDQGAEYPDYVSVTSWDQYTLEERHPDAIFFHNPYDECNTVTRVPERYYASRLKECTKNLVYIPYFVSVDGGPADHQCYMPGVLLADRVVVQPGVIYEKYCRIYTQTVKDNGWEKILVPAEEKFLPFGSPKIDKIMNMTYKLEDLPESWQKLIFKPDGTKKKIVFYNLTIMELLRFNEQMLRKVDKVFRLYKEKQDEVVLFWRPHPLLFSAIDTMRPQLREAYLALVENFKEEGWGIFDETPDPHLGMALSDAYYGDDSSLMIVYHVTGKPLVLQSVAGTEESSFLDEVINNNMASSKTDQIQKESEQKNAGTLIYQYILDLMS